jgi:hypothetical protein
MDLAAKAPRKTSQLFTPPAAEINLGSYQPSSKSTKSPPTSKDVLFMKPDELASRYNAHDLLHIASEAMEAIANMADDDLDVSSDEDDDFIKELTSENTGTSPRTLSVHSTEHPKAAEHLEEEVCRMRTNTGARLKNELCYRSF